MPELYDTRAPNPPSRADLDRRKTTKYADAPKQKNRYKNSSNSQRLPALKSSVRRFNLVTCQIRRILSVKERLKNSNRSLKNLTPTQSSSTKSSHRHRRGTLSRRSISAAIDRTGLILQVFAQRALTKEARLQVALAQLEYALPRLTRMWTHLSRLATGRWRR